MAAYDAFPTFSALKSGFYVYFLKFYNIFGSILSLSKFKTYYTNVGSDMTRNEPSQSTFGALNNTQTASIVNLTATGGDLNDLISKTDDLSNYSNAFAAFKYAGLAYSKSASASYFAELTSSTLVYT